MKVDIREIEALNYLFLRVMGKVFLGPYSTPENNEMTGAQKRILYFLDIEGPQRMSEIARLVAVSLPAASAVVDRLVRSGLVHRESDPEDRRVIRIGLTAQGRRVLARIKQMHEKRLAEMLERLPSEKRSELVGCFERIYDLMTEIDDHDRA